MNDPWTGGDSADLDRRIKANRIADRRERPMPKDEPPLMVRPGTSRGTPRRKPNGRWQGVITVNGRRHRCSFDTKAEAQAWLDRMEATR